MQDKVSIIIPCYNQATFLADAIASAQAQSWENKEIIVIDDGSTDNTAETAKRNGCILVSQQNKGLPSARNAGIKKSSGQWLLPLDADDKLHRLFIEETINKNDIVSTNLVMFGKENRLRKSSLEHPQYKDFLRYNYINYCSLFKREIWDRLGGYDENMTDGFEDWDFWRRATKAGYTVTFIYKNLFFYRTHYQASLYDHAVKNRDKILNYMRSKGQF